MDNPVQSFFVIALVATLAPIVGDFIPHVRIPVVVLEITAGILIGPDVLDFIQIDTSVDVLSEFGLAFLFFLAGYEIDFNRIKGRPLALAIKGWVIGLALALFLSGILEATGLADSFLYVGLAMTTTALGTLMPILSDEGLLEGDFGTQALAIGAVGEFGPIILVALLLDPDRGGVASAIVLNLLVLVVVGVTFVARRWHAPRLARLVARTMHSSAQLAVRLAMLLVVGLVFLAVELRLEYLLGAFGAGIVVGQAAQRVPDPHHDLRETVRAKFEAIGFGFVIPIFFVVSGVTFELPTLLDSPSSLAMIPVFLLLFLVVRGVPILRLYRPDVPERENRLSLGLFAATELPLVIAITGLGVEAGELSVELATAMVGSAMLSVFLFPLLALSLRQRAAPGRVDV